MPYATTRRLTLGLVYLGSRSSLNQDEYDHELITNSMDKR